jgi:hypothetical protein
MKNFYQKRGGVSKQDRLLPKPEDAALNLDGLVRSPDQTAKQKAPNSRRANPEE